MMLMNTRENVKNNCVSYDFFDKNYLEDKKGKFST